MQPDTSFRIGRGGSDVAGRSGRISGRSRVYMKLFTKLTSSVSAGVPSSRKTRRMPLGRERHWTACMIGVVPPTMCERSSSQSPGPGGSQLISVIAPPDFGETLRRRAIGRRPTLRPMSDTITFRNIVDSEAALRELYRLPHAFVTGKVKGDLDPGSIAFIGRSPFVLVGTQGPDGLDVSPRGGAPGFVKVLGPDCPRHPRSLRQQPARHADERRA